MKKSFSLRTRLIMTFLVVGMSPLIISTAVSYLETSSQFTNSASEKAKLVGQGKAAAISQYFATETDSLADLATSPVVKAALKEFSTPFEQANRIDATAIGEQREEVVNFYKTQFASLFEEKAGHKPELATVIDRLDPIAVLAQLDFIVRNENPLGKKDQMLVPKRESPYANVHARHHEFFREHLVRHSLYDMFLVNTEGRVVYTVFKESDFATDLRNGPWASSGLAKAFEAGLKANAGEVWIEDFAPYFPSYEAPASFASSPIMVDGKVAGVILIQLPLDRISAVAGTREGLGERGETLLIGSDGRLRADTFRNKATHTVANSFADKAEAKLESALVTKALKGETGVETGVSYDGLKTLSYFAPMKIRNLTWAIVTELDEAEVYADLRKLTYYMMAIILIGVACISLVAYFFGTNIASRLRSFAGTLRETSNQLSDASGKGAATATSLSESTTEQASSIQETMASAEEISAMVNQNAESSAKALSAVDSNLKASDNGSRSVDEMLVAIREIKDANTQILEQMDASNKEFAEIVRIITEIGEKTNVINEIVFQTKLLSFNASVEAARAGEHGKGFAVVAEEVGNLAQMSGNAAKEITDMLSDSIKRVNGIVEKTKDRIDHLVEVGKDKIATGQSTAQKCRDALNSVNENAKSIATMISEIANASKEQAQGIQEINKAIAQMDQVTQINSATANQSSSQATQLSTDAATLGQTVNELLHFVEGQSNPTSLIAPADSVTKGKIIPLKKVHATATQAPSTQALKATGTSPVAPSSNDPGFEEF